MTKHLPRAGLIAFVALLAFVALGAPPFWVTLGNYIGLYSIVALGLVLLTGVAGQTSFGQAAFVGIGAYTTAILSTQYAMSPWLNLCVGLALTLALALCLGGGDDYELCFTAPRARSAAVRAEAEALGLPCTRIGTVSAGTGIGCGDFVPARAGFRHFGEE